MISLELFILQINQSLYLMSKNMEYIYILNTSQGHCILWRVDKLCGGLYVFSSS